MKFKFDAQQEHQIKAIESIAALFDGQGKIESGIRYAQNVGFVGFPNTLDLAEEELLANLKNVQNTNNIELSSKLESIGPRDSASYAKTCPVDSSTMGW